MPTRFDTTWVNTIINGISGQSTLGVNNQITFINPYSGAQTATPSDTPTGEFVIQATFGIEVRSVMPAVSGGISALATPRSGTSERTVTVAFARLRTNNGASVADVEATTAGGGGGVIVNTLSAVTGVSYSIDEFSVKMGNDRGGTFKINNALRDGIVGLMLGKVTGLNFGLSCVVQIYSGTPPASANDAATGTLLWTYTSSSGASMWNAASSTSAALSGNLTANGVATGTAGYVRLTKGSYVAQASIGTGTEDVIVSTTSIVTGVSASITSANLSFSL